MPIGRRTFLIGGGAFALGAAPSDRIHLGVIGSGSRGRLVMETFQRNPGVRVAAICDVYEPNLAHAITLAKEMQDSPPTPFRDYRRLLESRDINAVLIATPDHWHHRMILDALDAGKDVYVEKPLCRTPREGVELVAREAASKNIVQVGSQRRSYDLYLEGRKIVAGGMLGKIRMTRSWWLNNALAPGRAGALEGSIDWAQWLGPAPKRPLDPDRFHSWRYYSDYGGGVVSDLGSHLFDGIHLLMNAGPPLAVNASAGKPHKPGVDMPESVVVTAEYPEDFIAIVTINQAAMAYKRRNDQMNHLDGDLARMDIGREDFTVYNQRAEEKSALIVKAEKNFDYATDQHVQNFIECVRTRSTPTAPMSIGFQAALVTQMANLSLKQGRRLKWKAATQTVEA